MSKEIDRLIASNTMLVDKTKELFEDIKILIRYINQEYKNYDEYINLLINVNEIIEYYNNKKVANKRT